MLNIKKGFWVKKMFSNFVGKISSALTSATTTDFPFVLGDEVIEWKKAKDCDIKIKKSDKEIVSVFEVNKKASVAFRTDAAKNGLQKLKTIRHPNILKCEGSHETEEKIYLVTEHVLPLAASIDKIGKSCVINEAFNALGLYQLAVE
ncbi:hypothetical protein RFI_09370 [Reticulomyxa filosa]|uniref:Protein kinase domain-containing protein n=1 Tax=Reticulomyxa filosa TaxID=46433 RepID=X6NP03_RETFI|nr:hypothetical protein RFI_09370 [Reticulomyxa filosa]|eukprot:ETO27751.1 hypothetical protein RFI_09370 [Reticulomyxa filosa]